MGLLGVPGMMCLCLCWEREQLEIGTCSWGTCRLKLDSGVFFVYPAHQHVHMYELGDSIRPVRSEDPLYLYTALMAGYFR